MTDSEILYCFGADGNPDNDSDPVGGTLDSGTDVVDTDADILHRNPVVRSTDQSWLGIAGRYNSSATGTWADAYFHNRCGGIRPSSSAIPYLYSNQNDTGTVWLAYKHAGNWTTRLVTLAGPTPIPADASMDANSPWLWLHGTGEVPLGDLVLTVNGETVGVMAGSANGGRSFCCSTFYRLAVATAQDLTLSAANRRIDPADLADVGAWSTATKWAGHDTTIALPGASLGPLASISYAVVLEIPGGCPRPPGGLIQFDLDLQGDPQE